MFSLFGSRAKAGSLKFEINAAEGVAHMHDSPKKMYKTMVTILKLVQSPFIQQQLKCEEVNMKVYVLIFVVLVVINSNCDASFPRGNKNTQASKNTKPSFNFLDFLKWVEFSDCEYVWIILTMDYFPGTLYKWKSMSSRTYKRWIRSRRQANQVQDQMGCSVDSQKRNQKQVVDQKVV